MMRVDAKNNSENHVKQVVNKRCECYGGAVRQDVLTARRLERNEAVEAFVQRHLSKQNPALTNYANVVI